MSSFSMRDGVLDEWNRRARLLTYVKLSCIALVLMKALWLSYINVFMNGCSLRAIIFVMIFATAWMRLIGLKSVIESPSSFLGISTMLVELRISNKSWWRLWKALIMFISFALIMPQHLWKKLIVKPSGPGALSLGMSLSALLTLSSVNSASREERSMDGQERRS